MKEHVIRLFLLFMVLSPTILIFTSCERLNIGFEIGNNTNNYREATEYLCSRVWVEEWWDENDNFRHQELRFNYNNIGQDYIKIVDKRGNIREHTSNFMWDWFSVDYTSLRLDYGTGYSYMDNMYMGNNIIDCLFDGDPARFIGR